MLTPNNSKPGGFKLKSRWLNRSEQDLSDLSCKSPTPAPVSVSTPLPSTPNSYQANDVSSSSSAVEEKMIVEPTTEPQPNMPSFERIIDNIYLLKEGNKTKSKDSKRMICECTLPEDDNPDVVCCGSDCLNRLLYIECGSKCRCGDHCTNRRFQQHEYSPVEAFPAGLKGWGLRSTSEIPKNAFVMEYVGEVLSAKKFNLRVKQYARDPNHKHHYFMALRKDEVIDATQKGNISRFINHSCQPNCETQKWTVNGRLRIGFFTIKDIEEGEEMTFDYRFQRYGKEAQKCYCGTPACRGFIGGDSPAPASGERRDSPREITKKKQKAPRQSSFEDMVFDQELSELQVVGTLKSRDQVLTYCRLMVRAEDILVRMQLMDILMKTGEPCLRLFIDHHGCQLLWSWMVDDHKCSSTWTNFQISVLKILTRLPIPHRNMVEDSRLKPIVQRWAKDPWSRVVKRKVPVPVEESDEIVIKALLNDLVSQVAGEGTPGTSETDGSPEDANSEPRESQTDDEKEKEVMQLAETVLEQWAKLKENFRIPKKATTSENNKTSKSEGISNTARRDNTVLRKQGLPHSMKKRGRSRSPSLKHRHKRPRSRSRSRSPSPRSRTRSRSRSRSRGGSSRHTRYHRRSKSPDRRRDHHNSKRKPDKHTPDRLSSVVVAVPADAKKTKEERRREFEAQVLRQQEEEENRKRMEMEMASAAQVQPTVPVQDVTVTYGVVGAPGVFWPAPSVPSNGGGTNFTNFTSGTKVQTLPANAAANAVVVNSGGTSGPNARMAGAAMAVLLYDHNTCRYWWQEQATKVLVRMADEKHVTAVQAGDYSVVPHFYHDPASGLIHEIAAQSTANVTTGVDDLDEVDMACDDDSCSKENRIALLRQEISTLQQQLEEKQAELRLLLEQDDSCSVASGEKTAVPLPPGWQPARDEEGNVYYYHAETKRTRWNPPSFDEPETKKAEQKHEKSLSPVKKPDLHSSKVHRPRVHHHIKRRSKPDAVKRSIAALTSKHAVKRNHHHHQHRSTERPPSSSKRDHKSAAPAPAPAPTPTPTPVEVATVTATTTEETPGEASKAEPVSTQETGNATTSTPVAPASLSDAVSLPSAENDSTTNDQSIGCTPHGTTMAAADTSSEVAKKLKESFKGHVSNHVIKYLSVYRKADCKVGKIMNNDDFKHLARKLTHAVMEKELKHCHRVEDLRVTESVLHKAKDYVKKYMAKIGPEYKRTNASP